MAAHGVSSIFSIFAVAFYLCVTPGCSQGPSSDGVDAAMESVGKQVQVASDARAIFSDASGKRKESFQYFSGEYGKPSWVGKISFYERYILTIKVPVEISPDFSVSSIGPAVFKLVEISSITAGPNGTLNVETSGVSHSFGETEWGELVKHKGDLSEVLSGVVTQSVDGFPGYWARW